MISSVGFPFRAISTSPLETSEIAGFETYTRCHFRGAGHSPVNFTDPSGYCFLGCFWKPIFKAVGNFLRQTWRAIVQIAATAIICGPAAPVCASFVSAAITGITSGDLGLALRAGLTTFATAVAFNAVGDITTHRPEFGTSNHVANIAGHALVGCASSVAGGGRCGPGALSGAAGSFASGLLRGLNFERNLVVHAVVGGVAAAAGGGNFANGAVTAAFGYLFNNCADVSRCLGARSTEPADIQADAWQRWIRDFRIGITVYFGYGLETTAGTGVGGGTGAISAGLFFNSGSTAAPDIEYGRFYMSAETTGFNLFGGGLFAGFNLGTVDDFKSAASTNATTPFIGGGANIHPNLGISGMSISQSGRAGASYGTTTTCTYSTIRSGC